MGVTLWDACTLRCSILRTREYLDLSMSFLMPFGISWMTISSSSIAQHGLGKATVTSLAMVRLILSLLTQPWDYLFWRSREGVFDSSQIHTGDMVKDNGARLITSIEHINSKIPLTRRNVASMRWQRRLKKS